MASSQELAARVATALQAGDRVGFLRAVKGLIDARAPLTNGWKSLTQPLIDFGEFDLACAAIDLYARAAGNVPAAEIDRALIYTRCSRLEQATIVLDRLAAGSDDASVAYLRGTIALNMGRIEQAKDALLAALAARPRSGQIYQTLSMLGPMDRMPEVADRIVAAELAMRAAPDGDRGSYYYALGKTLDDRQDYDRAFNAFAEGAAIIRRDRPYQPIADRAAAAAAIDGWSSDRMTDLARQVTIPTDRPIIVTGLPRSGSTLVEQILVSHSQVQDGAELGNFTLVVNELGGPSAAAFATAAQQRPPNDAARHYLHLLAQRFGKTGRVVDKSLEASRYLGTLATLMPDAPIVWMRRNALDGAWSCFSTWFLGELAWSWNQVALAEHFRLEDELLNFWQDVLGDRLMVVDYQALVRDKQSMIPQLLSHCGLPLESAPLEPEKTERLVSTNSVTQVRAPINTKAIGKGQRYARHLQPFVDAYTAAGGTIA